MLPSYFQVKSTGARLFAALAALIVVPCAARAQQSSIPAPIQISHAQMSDPSFSPDGSRIVYITLVAGKEQLFIANLDGSHSVQITRDAANHEDPAWSPDGKRIAFVNITDSLEVISLMNIDGSNTEQITPSSVRAIHPSWSADGLRIAYCTDDDLHPPTKNPSQIYVVDPATKKITQLISGGVNTYPAWSPDGKRMAFRRMIGTTNSEVFLANGDGSDARNITNDPAFDGWPAWSPDGKRIAFASNRSGGGNYQIFVMSADGSNVRLIADTRGRATAPKWTRDGARVYFTNCKRVDTDFDCDIFSADAGSSSK